MKLGSQPISLSWSGRLGVALLLGGWSFSHAAEPPKELPPQTPVPILSAQEELKKFVLPDGYRMELVLSDPDIKEPVQCVFDGNGRMYVAEMRTYMQDVEGAGEHEPTSRVSLHWSSRGDGKFDKHSVFIDKLLLPRMILPLADGILVGETDTSDIYFYRDTDGDGVADKKELFFAGGPRGGNLEHQPSGLIWDLDNWLYTTYNSYRLRWNGAGKPPLKEPTASNGGQWGLTQDNFGKPWFVNAGGERGPLNFQEPILYGDFNLKNQFAPEYSEVWPLVGLADVQGGESRYRPKEKTLNHFTATCGAEVYRGDRLPADLRGDLLFGEPVGRLIRRTKIDVREGATYLRNACDKSEFIRSTDPNFRPINMITAPDGCLYIVDMYRGIIQEGQWVRADSYLRKVVKQYSLDQNFGHGRIWRLMHKDFKPGPQPRMQKEKPAQLVAHLDHPNGWWRDTAQKLLVLSGDKSVVPTLLKMARSHKNYLARIHALWTLEGLEALEPAFIREKLKDEQPQVRIAAIRVSESLFKKHDSSLQADIQAMAGDKDPNVVIQALLTAKLMNWPEWKTQVLSIMARNPAHGVQEIGKQLIVPPREFGGEFTDDEKKLLTAGEEIYSSLCFSCHGHDGRGFPVEGAKTGTTLAPPLAGGKLLVGHRDLAVLVLLHGLAGPVDGKQYDAQMVSMASNDDVWIASVLSYARNSFGNHASTVTAAEVARLRATTKDFPDSLTGEEIQASVPKLLPDRAAWKITASHNEKVASLAVDGDLKTRYSTLADQKSDMWLQIELPQETTITGLVLDAGKSAGDYPRGYQVKVSSDGETWSKPVAKGKGNGAITEILFAPIAVKFIKISQTGTAKGSFWSICELNLYGPSPKPEFKGDRKPILNPYE